MKKKMVLLCFASLLFANKINVYTYNLNFNYKEYEGSAVLDGESTKFGDLLGVGIEYKEKGYFFKTELAYGQTTYDGASWDNTPLHLTSKKVSLITLQYGKYIFNSNWNIGVGYRQWIRGKSDYSGDYNEKYYWPFVNIGYDAVYNFEKFYVEPVFEYDYAINPQIYIALGDGTKLALGTTSGFKGELKFGYRLNSKFDLYAFYRYQYWHINKSNDGVLSYNNQNLVIYEPESKTRNQYLGLGISYKF